MMMRKKKRLVNISVIFVKLNKLEPTDQKVTATIHSVLNARHCKNCWYNNHVRKILVNARQL